MLLADERRLQPDLVGADRIVPVASVFACRDLTLRHQLNVLRRKSPQRPTFSSIDRLGGDIADGFPVATIECKGDADFIAIFAGELEAIGTPARIGLIDGNPALVAPCVCAAGMALDMGLFVASPEAGGGGAAA